MVNEGQRPAYSLQQQRAADQWKTRLRDAERRHRTEIDAASGDAKKQNEIVRKIHGEIGSAPELCRSGYGIPASWVEVALIAYEETAEISDKNPGINQSGIWVCKICDTENTGNFCKTCGAKRN